MNLTRKIAAVLALAALVCSSFQAAAQTTSREDYVSKYNLLVSKLGLDGVGVSTLLDKWERDYPEDPDPCVNRFYYYYQKCRSVQAIQLPQEKYLGNAPLLAFKDSLGNPKNWFEDTVFDDEMFGQATASLDKAISLAPERLDVRFLKATALVQYEKESPDMAMAFLRGMVDYNGQAHPKWVYPGADKVDAEFFCAGIQEYCITFFRTGSQSSYQAFADLSSKMLQYYPSEVLFLTNMGSYNFVCVHNHKEALKYYNKVLKLKPGDYTAAKNCVLLARKDKNVKLEKKYLKILVNSTEDENERTAAQMRLKALETK